ncbi:hypothetical protein TL16_g06224 [Triparma laevis f. inornata]|uniref:Major facilitator superfamily (MFS) profile domain-containing protein n=2 Tax=Triparma laevis TaxID=1534972 RepID=A0A9W7FL17_9STRA|nr:hypothetical protein TL16_g06224 [Triparma laevis f. inornata]GMI14544.1 hypothetical protein TrLO_g4903 [Triparma laevis f. longispina]
MRSTSELRAFYYDVLFRAPLFISILFLSTAFLKFANEEAGCTEAGYDVVGGQTEEEADLASVDCTGRAYGIRPSSVLTTLNSVAGLILAFLLPIIGSIIDHTSYRKQCVIYAGAMFWGSNVIQIFTNKESWFGMVVIQGAIGATSYMIHQTAIFAYATEIVNDLDTELLKMNASVRVWELCTMLGFMVMVTVVGMIGGFEVEAKAATSQALAALFAMYPGYVVFKNLGDRPNLNKVPAGSSVLTAGFGKVIKTSKFLKASHPEVLKFLRALLFFESANGSIIFASTTLITQQLKIEDPSPILLAILVISAIGAGLVPFLHRKLGVKKGMMLVVFFNVLGSLIVILFVHSEETKGGVWIVGMLYGLGLGATYPMQRTFYMLIIPAGLETQMMGLLQFCSIVLGWAPGLVFTAVNEKYNNLRLAMFAVMGFHTFGMLLLGLVDVEKGRLQAKATEHLRIHKGAGGEKGKEGEDLELVTVQVGGEEIGDNDL